MKLNTLGGLGLLLAGSMPLQAHAEQSVHDVTVLNTTQWVVEAGQSGDYFPVMLKASERCFFVGPGALDPQAFKAKVRVERKVCDEDSGESTESTVKGFVVGSDQLAGLPIECQDVFTNKAGSRLCLNARLAAGSQGHAVLMEP